MRALPLLLLAACSLTPPPCDADQCAPACAEALAAAEAALIASGEEPTEAEMALLRPYVDEVRAGVRLFTEGSVGVCASKDCGESVMPGDAGLLPDGQHLVKAEIFAPRLVPEGGWQVHFAVRCELRRTGPDGEVTTSVGEHERDHKVTWRGGTRGYRIEPLYVIESPSGRGAEDCHYTLTLPGLGDPTVIEGAWQVNERLREPPPG